MAKKAEPTTELAVQESPLVTIAAPAHIEKTRGDSFATVDAGDVLFDRLSIMQDKTKEVEAGQFESGDIVRKSIGEVVYTRGGEPCRFIIAAYFKEFVEFGDRTMPTEPVVLNKTTDRNSVLAQEAKSWLKKKQQDGKLVRKVQDVHNFVILRAGRLNEPLLLNCLKSSYKAGQSLLALTSARGDFPMYAGAYVMKSAEDKNRHGTFNIFSLKNDAADPWANPEEYAAAKRWHEFFMDCLKKGSLAGVYMAEDAADEDTGPQPGQQSAATKAEKEI